MKLYKLLILIILLVGAVYGGKIFFSKETEVPVEKEVIVEVPRQAPVMDRIAKCESGANHFDKNGQVLLRGNKDKTVDVGYYQINSRWFVKATELKLNLTVEQDNKKFGEYLYSVYGTEPWVWSKQCWNK